MKNKLKILYAEDNIFTANEITEELEERGYEVQTVHDGNAAWSVFQEHTPDIVLLDQEMPGKKGIEVYTLIRKINSNIPILILSSHTECSVRALKLGAADFIRKESDMDEICTRIELGWQRSQGKYTTTLPPFSEIYTLTQHTTFHSGNATLTINAQSTTLKSVTADLMTIFCQNPDINISQSMLCKRLWNNDSASKIKLLHDYISELRKILKPDPDLSIISFYGKGYCLKTLYY